MAKSELKRQLEEARENAKEWEENWGICRGRLTVCEDKLAICKEREEILKRILEIEDKRILHLIFVHVRALLGENENNQM